MSEGPVWLAVVSGVGGLLVSLLTLYKDQQKASLEDLRAVQAAQYQQKHDSEAAQRESRKPFLDVQMTLYFEASNTAAKIAVGKPKSPEWEVAKERFWQLYWGSLGAVEDNKVASAMVAFGNALTTIERENRSEYSSLAPAALQIAHASRDSLKERWDVPLGEITAQRTPPSVK